MQSYNIRQESERILVRVFTKSELVTALHDICNLLRGGDVVANGTINSATSASSSPSNSSRTLVGGTTSANSSNNTATRSLKVPGFLALEDQQLQQQNQNNVTNLFVVGNNNSSRNENSSITTNNNKKPRSVPSKTLLDIFFSIEKM